MRSIAVFIALSLFITSHSLAQSDNKTWLKGVLKRGDQVDPNKVAQAVRERTQGKYSVPLFCMRHALKLNPLDSRYPFLMGCTLLHMGQGNNAMSFIDEAIAAAPSNPEPVNLKAEYLRGLGDLSGHIKALRHSLRLDKTQRKIHYRLAKALLLRDGLKDEEEAVKHAIEAAGDSPAMATKLADNFNKRSSKNRLLDLAAELRTNRAIADLRSSTGGPQYTKRYTGATSGGSSSSSKGPFPVTRVRGVKPAPTSHTGRYKVMDKDEYFVVEAGKFPRYERLRQIRAQRRAARGQTSP